MTTPLELVLAIDSFRAGKGAISLLAVTPLMTELIKSCHPFGPFLPGSGMLLIKGFQSFFTQGASQTVSMGEKNAILAVKILPFLN